MKFLLISAALVAVAFASPVLVKPELTGPSPIVNDDSYEGIFVDPAIIGQESISVGPEFVDEAVNAPVSPVVQIILNINSQTHVIDVPVNPVEEIPPTPVIIAEEAEESDVVPEPVLIGNPQLPVVPAPVQIGNPELPVVPSPVIIMPDQLN
ncbi:uncharacterized protein LOC125065566 [Vanessa atalanta]|uniref:uncharacterized protein LOC125065566 n=1 Tax=Vanessa atalanta TaxID=42275 RepID=UPI001FCDE934|nr:uncharacterized protein LOC125065566 [Vanessa atalanta]